MTGGTTGLGAPEVPGLVLDLRLGVGMHGEVWRALDVGAARSVAVQVGRPAAGAGAAAREAALLRRLDHEGVAHVRSVLDLADGRRAVVLDLVPGGDLETLMARRGALTSGEVATVAAAMARALDHIHTRGFVHGRLTPHDVLLTVDGRPVLAGVGIPALLRPTVPSGPPSYPTPADDVQALGEVLRVALTGGRRDAEVPGPLGRLVAACRAADPTERPTPARLAVLAEEAAVPMPVRLEAAPGRVERSEPRDGTRPRWSRRPLGVGLGLAAAALLAGGLVVGSDPAQTSSAGAGLGDARGLVASLADARAAALTARDDAQLAAVDAPGSGALASDTEFIARLRGADLVLRGLGFDVAGARVVEISGERAVIDARVATSPYEQLRADGSVVRQVAATPPRVVRLTLVRSGPGWRIAAAG